mgnify:CR=1 FL=1
MDKLILHCDLNNFFASASLLAHPELKDQPVAVAGDPERRHGIILAKNIPAKIAGVKTAEAIWQSLQKCPNLILLKPDYPLYIKFSEIVREIYYRYTGNIEPFGIDEAWLDISQHGKDIRYGAEVAHELKEVIKSETKLTVSIGVSFSKVFAKLGSDYKKPDAVTVISRENYKDLVWPLPAEDLIYVGRATKQKLNRIAITTIGDLANADPEVLRLLLGKNGLVIRDFANGNDGSLVKAVDHEFGFKGIGNSMTTTRDLICDRDIRISFLLLSEMVAQRMRAQGVTAGNIGIYLRDKDLAHITRQKKLNEKTFISDEITDIAMDLYYANWDIKNHPVRSLGIRSTDFSNINGKRQLSFFDSIDKMHLEALEFAKDDIIRKYGKGAVTRAVFLEKAAPKEQHAEELHDVHPLSFFRK